MRFGEIQIDNYKSLRKISISPTPLCTFVGPNAAGKSNLCDALDFLGETYRLGLEMAVSRKGGYENICFRRQRRSKAPIRFAITFELSGNEGVWFPFYRRKKIVDQVTIFKHSFEIRAESQNIKAPFYVASEKIRISLKTPKEKSKIQQVSDGVSSIEKALLNCVRNRNEISVLNYDGLKDLLPDKEGPIIRHLIGLPEPAESKTKHPLPSTDLMLSPLFRGLWGYAPFLGAIGSLRVFQLSPRNCRESGVPTPNPELDRFGGNLPAVVEYLKSYHRDAYSVLLTSIRRVMPTLEGLETQYTHRKTLGLFVSEEGFGRPWAAEDVSDGTIQTIALLVAAFDPRTNIVVIEEPENSIHPWAIRNFVKAAREASKGKQIILTTHSPVLIDQLKPEELWVVRRPKTETIVDLALNLDPSLAKAWGEGHFTLSEYLDSGIIPEAVPAE